MNDPAAIAAALLEDEDYDPKEEIMRLAPDNLMPERAKQVMAALSRRKATFNNLRFSEQTMDHAVIKLSTASMYTVTRRLIRETLLRNGLSEIDLVGVNIRIDCDDPEPGAGYNYEITVRKI